MKAEKHCTSIDCAERRSICCNAKPKDAMGKFICRTCGIDFKGGECTATYDKKITDEYIERLKSNPNRGVKVGDGDGEILKAFRSNLIKEERKSIGENILKIHKDNGRDEEIALNDILRYADHLITGQEL